MRKPLRYLLIAGIGVAAGLLSALVLTLTLAITDIYLSGHNQAPLGRAWLDIPDWGIHLSRADVIMLSGTFLAAVISMGITAAILRRNRDN